MSGTGSNPRYPQGLTLTSVMRSRLRNREVSTRKQVGDADALVNQETSGAKWEMDIEEGGEV